MANRISWTDESWNPSLGCERVSAGCDGCYAIPASHMRASNPHPKIAAAYTGLTHRAEDRVDWTGKINLLEDRLPKPLGWKKPRRIFVNSMSDLFHDKIHAGFIADVFAVMALTPQHSYQLLTKRHGRMRSLLNEPEFWYRVGRQARHIGYAYDQAANYLSDGRNIYDTDVWKQLRYLPNVWLGVSVEDQHWADIRIPALLDTPAAVRWISAEPLLGPVLLEDHWIGADPYRRDEPSLSWVVTGGESGHKARPVHPNWVRSIRDQCQAADVAFHHKQWGEWGPATFVVRVCDPKVGWLGTAEELVEAKRAAEAQGATHVHTGNWYVKDGRTVYHIHEIGHPCWGLERAELPDDHMAPIRRWGKATAGRVLDGKVWDEYPAVTR